MEKQKTVKAKKERLVTMMAPKKTHLQLSRMVIKYQAAGVRVTKQALNAAIIDYFNSNPDLLKQLSFAK